MNVSDNQSTPSWQSLLELAALATINAANDEIYEAIEKAERLIIRCIMWRESMPNARSRRRKTLIAIMHTACLFWSEWPKEITKFIIRHGGLHLICEFLEYQKDWMVKGYQDEESEVIDFVVAQKTVIRKIDRQIFLSQLPSETTLTVTVRDIAYAN